MTKIKPNQDVLLLVQPKDADGGPTTVLGNSMIGVSSNFAAFDNPFLDPPNQSEVGRVSYSMKAMQHGNVGDVVEFTITANARNSDGTPGLLITGTVQVEIVAADAPDGPPPAVALEVVASPLDRP